MHQVNEHVILASMSNNPYYLPVYGVRYAAGGANSNANPASAPPLMTSKIITSPVYVCDDLFNASKLANDFNAGFVLPQAQAYELVDDKTPPYCIADDVSNATFKITARKANKQLLQTPTCVDYDIRLSAADNVQTQSTATLRDCTAPDRMVNPTGAPQGAFIIDGEPIGMKGNMYCAIRNRVFAGYPETVIACRHVDTQKTLYVKGDNYPNESACPPSWVSGDARGYTQLLTCQVDPDMTASYVMIRDAERICDSERCKNSQAYQKYCTGKVLRNHMVSDYCVPPPQPQQEQ